MPRFLRISTLHRLILRSYIGPLALTFSIAMFILILQFLWKYIDDMVGKGFELSLILELLFYASATFVPMALPLAILFSSIMTLGRFAENTELVAIKSSGVSFQRFIRPLVLFSAALSMLAFYFSNNVLPVANLKMLSLLYDVRAQKPAVDIQAGIYYTEIDNFVIKIGSKDKDDKTIRDVVIYDHTGRSGNSNITYAKSGVMRITPNKRYLIFQLYNGYNYLEYKGSENKDRIPFQTTHFRSRYQRIDLKEFAFEKTNESAFKDHYRMLNLKQLDFSMDSLQASSMKRMDEYAHYVNNGFRHFVFLDSSYTFEPADSMYVEVVDSISEDSTVHSSPFLAATEPADTIDVNGLGVIDYLKPGLTLYEKKKVLESAVNVSRNFMNQSLYVRNDVDAKQMLINRHEIEWHRKFTLSIACLILFFIGAPLGSIIRRGGLGMPTLASTLLFIIYHIISLIGEKAAREGAVTPEVGMWIASFIFLPAGMLLTYKASTEASVLNEDSWSKGWSRIRNLLSLTPKRRNIEDPSA